MLEQNPVSAAPPWRLVLLDGPTLHTEGPRAHRLERKTAGLLAYLALCGPTPRSRLAGLLWPEVDEDRARSNLRQCLFRLKKAAGRDVVLSEEPLRLAAGLEADAARLEVLLFERRYAEAARQGGGLLAAYDYDDCPEFADWLLAERERLEGLRREALRLESERLEEAADLRGALAAAERWLEAEPVSEAAHRRVMRLLYLLGDRPAALAAFERCEAVLKKELGVRPLAETLGLLRLIERGNPLSTAPAPGPAAIPLTVLRPPVLVGREAEWAQMEVAWARGQVVFLRGEPGVGKSRLALDFAASKGRAVLLAARPGDREVPYSSYGRSLRESFAESPHLFGLLPAWVRRELSRLLPELAEGEPPPPITSEAEKGRFYDALGELTTLTHGGPTPSVQVSDDAQYLDPASVEAMLYQLHKFGGAGGASRLPFTIEVYRRGEIDPGLEQGVFEPLVERGQAVMIDLGPLPPERLGDLLTSLELPQVEGLAESLGRYTGGNPFFVLETLKSLWESGGLRGRPEKLPVAGKVKALIARRLERLSPFALNLARVAAVAATDFGPELAAAAMDSDPLTLAQPWSELEAAQILTGHRFVHDLLFETVQDGLPAPIKTYLHRRVAEFLEAHRADPARVAGHWLEAGQSERAVPFLLEAARYARATHRLEETLRLYGAAADALEALGRQEQAFEVVWQTAQLLDNVAPSPHHQAVSGRVRRMAQSPAQRAVAGIVEGRWLTMMGQVKEGERATREGYRAALESGDPKLEVELQNLLAINLWYQDRYPESIPLLQRSVQLSHALGLPELIAPSTGYLGAAQVFLDKHLEARANLGQALHILKLGGEKLAAAQTLTTVADSFLLSGQPREALGAALEAQALLENVSGASERAFTVAYALSDCHYHLGRYRDSLEAAQSALEALGRDDHRFLGGMHYLLARTLAALGANAEALEQLEQALAHKAALPRRTAAVRTLQAALQARLGREARLGGDVRERLESPEAAIRPHWPASTRINLLLQQTPILPPDPALEAAQQALELAQTFGLEGFRVSAQTRLAQVCLELSLPDQALRHIHAAELGRRAVHPPFLHPAELPLTRYRVAKDLGDGEAQGYLEAALGWLDETLETQVPPPYRQSFLTQNPTNRAILEAAAKAGLVRKA